MSALAFVELDATEDQSARWEVQAFAQATLDQQRKDWLQVRRDAQEHEDPAYRQRCREVVINREPPSWDECLRLSMRVRRKREVDRQGELVRRV